MCFAISMANKAKINKQLEFWTEKEIFEWTPTRYGYAFTKPTFPIVLNDPVGPAMAQWQLVPGWIHSEEEYNQAEKAGRLETYNAKCETLFERASFKAAARSRRCLIVVDAFYESHWDDLKGKKTTLYKLTMADDEPFLLAGLFEWDWTGKPRFTIVTMPANELMTEIHNSKKRMPVVVPFDWRYDWMAASTPEEMAKFFVTNDALPLHAEVQDKSIRGVVKKEEPPTGPVQGELF